MKLKGIKPVDYELVVGLNGPPTRKLAEDMATNSEYWDSVAERNAGEKMRKDAIDERMRRNSVNAGQYDVVRRDYNAKIERNKRRMDETIRADVEDNMRKQSSSPQMKSILNELSSISKSFDAKLSAAKPRGSGKAMTKSVNHWKVK